MKRRQLMKFSQLCRKHVDLLSIDAKHCIFQIGYHLRGYSFCASSAPAQPGLPHGIRVVETTHLELEDHARLYMASKRTRPRLARVLVEPSTFEDKPVFDAKLRRNRMEAVEPLTGYRLRDTVTNHVWLTLGVRRAYRIDFLGTFTFECTPP